MLVVTQPDRPAGRGHRLRPTPVKATARELGIETWEPLSLRNAAAFVAEHAPDLFGVASYGRIVPRALLDVPRIGALNVHPSLLPLYRGAAPLVAQIRDGVTDSGVTIILMDEGMDTGDIVLQEHASIAPDETYGDVHDRFAVIGARLLAQSCAMAATTSLPRTPQQGLASNEEIGRTLTRPLTKADLLVEWTQPAQRIVDHVRSLSPAPGARALLDGEFAAVKILQAHASREPDAGDLAVACADGFVVVDRLVPPNRAPMSGRAYAAAHHGGSRHDG
jgi:methionyl-tRNA formyltransferase